MTRCTHDRDRLVLLALGELSGEERAVAERQVEDCEHCARVLAEIEEVRLNVPSASGVDPERARVARERAIASLGGAVPSRTARSPKLRLIDRRGLKWVPHLVAASILVAAGYGLASLGNRPAASASDAFVRQVHLDGVSGEIELLVRNGTDRWVRGMLQDLHVREALAVAVGQSDDLRVRLHALRAMGAEQDVAPRDDDPLVKALTTVLAQPAGPAEDPVKLRAVEVLAGLYAGHDLPEAVQRALLTVVSGASGPAVRIAAMDELVSRRVPPDALAPLARLASADPNSYVRLLAAQATAPLEALP